MAVDFVRLFAFIFGYFVLFLLFQFVKNGNHLFILLFDKTFLYISLLLNEFDQFNSFFNIKL